MVVISGNDSGFRRPMVVPNDGDDDIMIFPAGYCGGVVRIYKDDVLNEDVGVVG